MSRLDPLQVRSTVKVREAIIIVGLMVLAVVDLVLNLKYRHLDAWWWKWMSGEPLFYWLLILFAILIKWAGLEGEKRVVDQKIEDYSASIGLVAVAFEVILFCGFAVLVVGAVYAGFFKSSWEAVVWITVMIGALVLLCRAAAWRARL